MPHLCPRPCSRLATAAVFLSVGVVQFVVGIILLRSKFVFLLAGPDFWTSFCNVAVGCLLGVSASIWKQSRKRESKKHTIRRHLLLALVFSALIINATTLAILLLGESNALLSIRLESNGKYSETTFAGEVLAYAFVTSVCCPVVCIVVSIVSMSGSCFNSTRKNSIERKFSLAGLKKSRSESLQWVYAPESRDLCKKKPRDLVPTTSSEDSSDSDSDDIPIQQKHSNSIEELQTVLSRMAHGKRDSILSDSAIMLRQLDLRRKNRHSSLNQDGSYVGAGLSHINESSASERSPRNASAVYSDSCNSKTVKSKRHSPELDDSSCISSGDISLKRITRSINNRPDIPHKLPYAKEYKASSQTGDIYSSTQNRNFREKHQNRPKVTDNTNKYTASTRKESKQILEIERMEKSVSVGRGHREKGMESPEDNELIVYKNKRRFTDETGKPTVTSPDVNDCFSPDGSEYSEDSAFDFSRTSSWAGEVVPISVSNSYVARLSHKLIPVASPVVPNSQQEQELPKMSDDSGVFSIQSTSFSSEAANQNEFNNRESKISSFREITNKGSKEVIQEYPKVGTQSIKKYDLSRVMTMASISEEPNLETNVSESKPHCSSQCETDTPQLSKEYSRRKSLPSVFPESRETYQFEENSERIYSPKRKRSLSGKALRKILSMALSSNQTDFLNQVVDDDSLIGLSEEELIARQFRNSRSIRKAVQQRIKEEMTV